jgi:hypothetical protein
VQYPWPMEGQPEGRGAGCFGLPAMIGVLAFVAVGSAVSGIQGLIASVLAVLVVFLIIGLALTIAKKE